MKSYLFIVSFAAALLAVLAVQDQCHQPRSACQWSGHYLGAAWSDTKFTGPNYRRGYHADYYAECCDLCQAALGCYKFHVLQVVAPDPEEPGSGLVNCFLHGQGAKEYCYSVGDGSSMNVVDTTVEDLTSTDNVTTVELTGDESMDSINVTDTESIPMRRRQLDERRHWADVRRRLSSSDNTAVTGGSVGGYELRSTTSASGDPHLVGFDGRAFDFQGYNGGVFNLLNQKSHNLNMLLTDNGLSGLTFIRALAFQYADKRVKVEAAPYKNMTTGQQEALLTIEFNGMVMEVAALDSDNDPPRLEAGEFWVSSRRAGSNSQEVHITSPGLQVVVTKNRNSRHLDLTTSVLRSDVEPMHGVLGQTYKFNSTFAQFEGDEIDYLVSGLWANDCKFCTLFTGEEMPFRPDPSVGGEDSTRRVLAASETPVKSAKASAELRPEDWAQSFKGVF